MREPKIHTVLYTHNGDMRLKEFPNLLEVKLFVADFFLSNQDNPDCCIDAVFEGKPSIVYKTGIKHDPLPLERESDGPQA